MRDARLLRDHGGSAESIYFAAGMAVECALKAIVLRRLRTATLPGKSERPKLHRHRIPKLIKEAGLKPMVEAERRKGSDLAIALNVIQDWNPNLRYQNQMPRKLAVEMLRSVEHRDYGVFVWLNRIFQTGE
jgi:hypothetical protein